MSRHHHSGLLTAPAGGPSVGTFGNTSTTSPTAANPSHGYIFGQTFTSSLSGTLTDLKVYCSGNGASQTFQADVYAVDGSGNPTSLLGTSTNQITITGAQSTGYITFTFTGVTVVAGQQYFLCLESSTTDSGANIYYQAVGGTGLYAPVTFGSPPSTFGAYSTESRTWCFYADVTVTGGTGGGGGASPGSVLAAVNCGGPPLPGWDGDTDSAPSPYLTVGNPAQVFVWTGHGIDLTDASVAFNVGDDPTVLQQMLQAERYDTSDTITYVIPGLPTGAVTVQVWESENYPVAQTTGGRVLAYAVNGVSVAAAEDTYADVGGYRGACYSFAATSTGSVTVTATRVSGEAVHLCGLRLLAGTVVGPAPGSAAPAGTLTVTSPSPPAGVIGSPYSYTFAAGGNSDRTFAWAVTSGTLPAGLTLSAGGVLSGTPTTAASSTFTVTVTGSPSTTTATRASTVTVQSSGSARMRGGTHVLTDYTAYPRTADITAPAAISIPGGGVALTVTTAAALQAAIDSHPAGTQFNLPSGTVTGSGQILSFKAGDSIYGVGTGSTILDNIGLQPLNGAQNVTLANMTVRNFTNTSEGRGAIDAHLDGADISGWQCFNVEVHHSQQGINLGGNGKAVNCWAHDNVKAGFGGGGSGNLYQYCSSTGNNPTSLGDGGNKTVAVNSTWLGCYFADNGISNWWADVYTHGNTIEDCIAVRGNFIGMMDEISDHNTFRRCLAAGNGRSDQDWQAAGIVISTSQYDTVTGCYAWGNAGGNRDISLMDQSGRSGGRIYGNNQILNNVTSVTIVAGNGTDTLSGNTVVAAGSINPPALVCGLQV